MLVSVSIIIVCKLISELLIDISCQTGILLDRVYTLKAVRGMLGTLKEDPARLKGKRVLFLHTGGIHSLFDGRLDKLVQSCEESNRVQKLNDFLGSD